MSGANKKTFSKWDAFVGDRFTYTHDEIENWRSHAQELLADKDYHMRDDCDGLASTVLDLLARDGVPLKNLSRCLVLSPQGKKSDYIDHMIGMAVDDNGEKWIVGDTFSQGKPVHVSRCPHKIVEVSCLDDGIRWVTYKGVGAAAFSGKRPSKVFVFGARSNDRKRWAHPALREILDLAITLTSVDFGITESRRSKAQQLRNYAVGASETMNSRHFMRDCYWKNRKINCCHAVDVMAYVGKRGAWIPWELYEEIARAMKAAADQLGYEITWGGDWRSRDGVHFELSWTQFKVLR